METDTAPLTPAVPALAVMSSTVPLSVLSPLPLSRTRDPPVEEAEEPASRNIFPPMPSEAVVRPDWSEISPPLPVLPVPTAS